MKPTLNSVKEADYIRTVFAMSPEHGTTLEDMLDPEYWAHVAAKLRPTCRIEVVSEDSTWFAELFVTAVGRNWASVTVLRFVELAEAAKPAAVADKFAVVWRGQNHLHSVVRKSDKAVIKEGFQSATEARAWLEDYETRSLV